MDVVGPASTSPRSSERKQRPVPSGLGSPVVISEPSPKTLRIAPGAPDLLQLRFSREQWPSRVLIAIALGLWVFPVPLLGWPVSVLVAIVTLLGLVARLYWLIRIHRGPSLRRVTEVLVSHTEDARAWSIGGHEVPSRDVLGTVTVSEKGRNLHHVYLNVRNAPLRLATLDDANAADALAARVAAATGLPAPGCLERHNPLDYTLWSTALIVLVGWVGVAAVWEPWFDGGGGAAIVAFSFLPGVLLGATRSARQRRLAKRLNLRPV